MNKINLSVAFENLKALALIMIIGSHQLGYLASGGSLILVIIGVFTGVVILTHERISFKSSDLFLLLLFAMMTFLGVILFVINANEEVRSRPIFFISIAQLFALLLVISLARDTDGMKKLMLVLCLLIVIEGLVVVGQFTYLTYGVGFSKIITNEEDPGFISGTLGNPNNSAAMIGLLTFILSAYYDHRGNKNIALMVLFMSLIPVFLTLSRTMLIFWALNLLCLLLSDINKIKLVKGEGLSFSFLGVSVFLICIYFIINLIENGNSDVIVRSVNRVLSLGDVESDSSIGFRLTSHLRLFENITQLGVGTFSDSNYFYFFRSDDFWLMNINPHSYLVEYSFLFGNIGFALISLVFISILLKIFLNFEIQIIFRIVAAIGLIFIQAVPSSMLTEIYFLISFIIFTKIEKQIKK
jgi:hypothetical protein